MATPLKIQIIVDDKGSVKIRQVGTEAEKAGRKGETAFRRTGKSLDEMNRKAAKATSHVLKLAAAAVSIGALYLAFRKITREVSEFIDLAGKQEAVEKRVEAVLKATGQAAGYNLSQLTAMASGMQKLTTVGDEVILSGQAILLTFKKIRGEGFERATMAALDMAEVMEGDLKGSIVMIGKALNDPIANLSAMTRAGVQFTAGQKDMIKQLWLSGKTMEAQNIILTELESQFGGAAAAARETYSGALKAAKNATGDLKEEVGFLIIKNEASIVLIKEVETWSIKMTTAIRDNKQAALEFVQDGLVALVAGAESAVKAIAYLIESIQNVSRVWLMTKSAFLSMEIQATKFKLWANEGEVSEKKIRMELLALEQAYADVALAIAATDKAHADMVDIVERATGGLSRLQEKLAELEVGLGSIDIPIDDFHGGMKKVNDTLDDTAKTLKELEKYLEGVESALNNVTTESTGAWFAYKQFHEGLGSSSGDLETVRLRLTGIYGEMAAIAQLEGEIDVTVNGIEDIKKLMGALDELESRASSSFKGESFGDGISQGINNAMRSFEELSDMYKEQAKIEKELIEKRKEANNIEDIEKRIKALEKIGDTEMELIDKQLAGYRQLFGTLKDLFDENSKEREAMHKAEQAFAILEIALEMRKSLAIITGYFAQSAAATVAATTQNAANISTALTGAAASVAAQGTVPVAGFAMVGAMLALMAGVLAMGGIAFGGGASVSIPEVPNYGPSTVLGAEPGTPSESIQNTYEMLEDAHADEYAALMDIYREVQDLNQNITGLVTGLIKGVGGDFGAIDTQMGDWIGGAENFWNKFTEGFAKFLSLDPIISIITKYVGGWISKLLGNIFGGGGYTDLAYAGIEFGEQALGDILRGADVLAKVFATIHKHTEGGWFGSDKDEWYTEYETLDQDAIDLLTKVFKSIGDSFVYLAEGLGVDVQKVYDYIIPLTKLDLKGMNADQISEAVSNFFSNMTDQMAEDLFGPIIKKYQQVGEGLYETAVRLVMEKEIFLSVLTMTGMAFEGTAEQAIALSQAVIDAAGGLEKLTEAAEAYFDGFLTDAEKFAFMGDSLAQAFDNLDVAFPTTRQGFKDLLNSIDLTTESGQDLYAALLNLAAASDEYYDTVEAGTQSIIDAQRELSGTQELGLSEDIAEKYGISLGTITKDWFRGMREMFLALSPEELAAWAATLGVSAEELAEDFLDLADAFGFVGMTIADAAEEIAKLFQGVNDFLSGTGLADKATRLWTQLFKTSTPFMTVAEGGGGKVPTPAELANMSERLSEWFYAAEAAARELGQAELEAIKLEEQVITSISNLIDQIDATIMSIKTSGLNVSLPTQIAEEIAVDYEAAYAAAHAGGTAEIQKYLSIAQTHLGTYQAAHKSSEKYQDEYARVMGHMEAMKADLEAGGYDAKILAELEKGNELTIEQTAAYIAAMEDVNANWTLGTDWINAWVGKLEEAHLAIDIDWGNYDGSIADALHKHSEYANLLGRAGGQTLIGGTGSGENLYLRSTTHAT